MLLVIDNYDSFTYNLVQMLAVHAEVLVRRNDQTDVTDIRALAPQAIVISPGPGRSEDSGCILDVVRSCSDDIPLLGVCLGLQALGQAYGAEVVRAGTLMHGKTSAVYHYGDGLFHGLPSPFTAMRYHSLVVEPSTIPPELEVTAYTSGGEIMGLARRGTAAQAVQFHPESILTEHGAAVVTNFLQLNGLLTGGRT